MANMERGAYEPRVDNVRGFEMADDDEQVEIEEGSRLPLLIVIALLVLAAFAGVVWLAYSQGVQRGRADAPRIIAAEPGPVKIAPANPGGVQTPYTGLKIYQQQAPADADADNSPPPAAGEQANPSAPPDLRPLANASPETAPPPATTQQAAATAKPVASPGLPPKNSTPRSQSVADNGAAFADTSSPEAATAAPVTAPKIAAATPGGSYVLQIGAYKSQSEANAAWDAYKAKHPMVSSYQSDVKQVDLGGKGVWYRLRIASFGDKNAAVTFCAKLKANGGTCFLAK